MCRGNPNFPFTRLVWAPGRGFPVRHCVLWNGGTCFQAPNQDRKITVVVAGVIAQFSFWWAVFAGAWKLVGCDMNLLHYSLVDTAL